MMNVLLHFLSVTYTCQNKLSVHQTTIFHRLSSEGESFISGQTSTYANLRTKIRKEKPQALACLIHTKRVSITNTLKERKLEEERLCLFRI